MHPEMGSEQRMTWGELHVMMQSVPGGKNFVPRMQAKTFDEFVRVLHLDLDEIIKSMESNPQHHASDDEDTLSYFVASMLTRHQYRANRGVTRGGNVDVTVEGRRDDFVWTAEAKIYRSLTAVREGFLQLQTRYSPADLVNDSCGLLIYIKKPDAATLLHEWRVELQKMGFEEMVTEDCPIRPRLAFLSSHKSRRSGLQSKTRHMSISLFQDPLDKSGLSAQKHIDARAARASDS
jgi:hypothetical protein